MRELLRLCQYAYMLFIVCSYSHYCGIDGGWLKEHPLPADKGSYGNFNDLSVKNQQIIREILESDYVPSLDKSYDEQILHKLRGFYSSCMDEDLLNKAAHAPLIKFTDAIKGFFRNKKRGGDEVERKRKSLTAALAFVHARGIEGLFDFDIDGDVGEDPNAMTLWFSQPSFGLPSKASSFQASTSDLVLTSASGIF